MTLGLAEILIVLLILAIMAGGLAIIILAAMAGGRRADQREARRGP